MKMTNSQKDNLRKHLDNFKANNGGCVFCRKPIQDFHCSPSENPKDKNVELRLYGLCKYHASNVTTEYLDDLPNQDKHLPSHPKPVVVNIIYKGQEEEVRFVGDD